MPRPPEARRRTGADNRSRCLSHGTDIWLHSKSQSDGAPVDVHKICEPRGGMAVHGVRRGKFICTARYTDTAREFPRDNQINLLDGKSLFALIARRNA